MCLCVLHAHFLFCFYYFFKREKDLKLGLCVEGCIRGSGGEGKEYDHSKLYEIFKKIKVLKRVAQGILFPLKSSRAQNL